MKEDEPLRFAPTDEVDHRAELVEEFVREVLRLPWAFVTDSTNLADFEGVRTAYDLSQACWERYGMGLEARHFEMPLYKLLDELCAARERRDFPN
jgi:hypothetical protein